ncbi:MAG: hypothetical protein ABJC12_06950 [Saprospiraceae bacterium]
MKIIIVILTLLFNSICVAQKSLWEFSGGWGVSGVNQIIRNNVTLEKHYKFNKKNNLLDNKFKNNNLHSGYACVSKSPLHGLLKGFKVNFDLIIYGFGSAYFKEEKFSAYPQNLTNDTINTPNWIASKYTLPCIEFGIGKKINIYRNMDMEVGIFCSYMVEISGTSRVILYDSVYSHYNKIIYYFYRDYPNYEFDDFNFGLRSSISLFPSKKIHPNLLYIQSLNDLSRKNIHIAQHANLWSINIGLIYNPNKNVNKMTKKHKK